MVVGGRRLVGDRRQVSPPLPACRAWRTFDPGVAPGNLVKPPEELGLVNGTLDLLVLRTLAWGPRHGFAIAKWIKQTSDDAILVEDRALYLALHRLEERRLVESEWGLSENNRRARYYRLTRLGRKQLEVREQHWTRYVEAVFKILRASESPGA